MERHPHGPARFSGTASARPAPAPGARRLGRVLIAASDPDLRLYVRVGLDDLAGEVVEAADGLEALRRLAGRPADLVIADAVMPRLDGLELARVMAGRGVPVVLLDGVSAAEVPGAAVLEKPFDRRQLRAAIRRLAAAEEDH